MVDRRCRKVIAILLTAAIIFCFPIQNVYATNNPPLTLVNQVIALKQTFWENFRTNFSELISGKSRGLAGGEIRRENNIVFVIENIESMNKTGNKTNSDIRRTNVSEQYIQTHYQPKDVELLARIIYAEARGESFEGQVAVGAVILNRTEHPEFPKTIDGVIYQKGQFSAVLDKQIQLTPDDEAYQAAQEALAGEDPSNGAIFYYNPKLAKDTWIKSRTVVRSIGNHKFCV